MLRGEGWIVSVVASRPQFGEQVLHAGCRVHRLLLLSNVGKAKRIAEGTTTIIDILLPDGPHSTFPSGSHRSSKAIERTGHQCEGDDVHQLEATGARRTDQKIANLRDGHSYTAWVVFGVSQPRNSSACFGGSPECTRFHAWLHPSCLYRFRRPSSRRFGPLGCMAVRSRRSDGCRCSPRRRWINVRRSETASARCPARSS
jgi:hypothetical protein